MKKLLIFMMAVIFAVTASAQNYNNYAGQSKFTDNWSLGVEGGIQTNLHDWNVPQGAVWGINLNKQLTPVFGLSLEGLAGVNNTANWIFKPGHFHNMNAIDNVAVYLDGRWNVTNTILGYNGARRLFEVETSVGVGYGHFFNNSVVAADEDALLVKTGLNLNFNLGQQREWTLTLKPAVVWNTSVTGKFDSRYAVAQLTAGVVYHFKTSNGTHTIAATPVPGLLAQISDLNENINVLRQKLADAENRAADVKTVEVVKETVKYVENTYVVTFAQNKAVLTDAAKEVLNRIPENTTVVIDAYASPEGTKKYNKTLSERRADAVVEYLSARNIKVAQKNAHGAYSNESNRIAFVTVQ